MLVNMFEKLQKYNPISLVSDNLDLVKGTEKISHIYPAIWISIVATIVVLAISTMILNRKKIG